MNTRIYQIGFLLLLLNGVVNAQWRPTFAPNLVISICSNDSLVFAGAYNNNFYISRDSGFHWTLQASFDQQHWIGALVNFDTSLFSTLGGVISRSTDDGKTWVQKNNGLGNVRALILSVFNDDLYATTSDSNIARSTDHGETWKIISSGNTFAANAEYFLESAGNFYLGGNGVVRSEDTGRTWVESDSGIFAKEVFCFASNNDHLFVGGSEGMFFVSSDKGMSWVRSQIENGGSVYSVLTTGKYVFVGMQYYGVIMSTDNGSHWTQVNDGFGAQPGDLNVESLSIANNYLFGRLESGDLWRRPLSDFDNLSVPSSTGRVAHFQLGQNYPNPADGSTTIPFEIPEHSHVTCTIYDMLGRQVGVVANEDLDPGSYRREFNTQKLPTGTYMCRLEAGPHVQTRTLIVR